MTNKDKLRYIMADPILWIETFVKIVDKKGKLVPFKLTPQQKYIMKNKGKFNIVLKSRQLGISVICMAYMLYLCTTRPNTHCMMMAHNDVSTRSLFNKLKQMYNDLPDCVRPRAIANNKNELRFENKSTITVCTANAKDNARSATLQYIHFSEVGLMKPEFFKNQFIAAEQALVADGCMVLESTAQGLNHYSELWQKVVSGEMPLWKHFFFGWVQDERMFADDYKQSAESFKSIYGNYLTTDELDDEELALKQKGASMEQLMWRRLKISNDGIDYFHQEFPANPLEAFVTTGSNIFSPEIIHKRLIGLSNTPILKLPTIGVDPIIKKYSKYLTLWKLPVKGKKFFLGVDVSEGLGGSNDYSVISVVDEDGFQCAEWRSNKVKPYEFTEVVYKMAVFYNKGLLAIEKASAGHTVIDRISHDYRYVNMYRYKAYDQTSGKVRRQIGWNTDSKSKPIMISDMQEMFETGQCLVNSKDLLQEMKLFQLVDNKMQAASGHDDTVMAFAIVLQAMKSRQYYYPFGK